MTKKESTSREDVTLEKQSKGKKPTEKPKGSKAVPMKGYSLNDEDTPQQESRSTKDKQKAKRMPKASKLSPRNVSVLNDEVSLQQQDSKATGRKKQTPKAKASKSENENPLEHESREKSGRLIELL
jgi:hypothetical protein